jgi:AI-2 transport protein TqsA
MPERSDESRWLITGSLIVLAAVALAFVLHYTRSMMIPFVLAIFVVSLVSPVLDFQVLRLRFPRPVAVAVTFVLVLVIIAILCLLIAQAVQTIVSTAGRYSSDFAAMTKDVLARMDRWELGVDRGKIADDLSNRIPSLVTNTLGTVFGIVSSLFFVLIFAIFLLSGRNPHIVHSGVYADMDVQIRRYIATKVVISIATGLLVWGALAAIELELAGVFGMLAFVLNFIPNIGSVISTLLPIPIAVAQFQSPWPIIYVLAVPGTIQMVVGNVVEPKLMGKGLNLHPVTVLLALFFWGLLWGVVGMFLAAPMTAVLRIVLMQFDTLKPLGKLLAGELPSPPTRSD